MSPDDLRSLGRLFNVDFEPLMLRTCRPAAEKRWWAAAVYAGEIRFLNGKQDGTPSRTDQFQLGAYLRHAGLDP
ncbi:hypothetical protein J6590_071314 [Homalodisca vitripennis]|nr:hypothetical protein J6590_071314 [Homalodisca vitripennis]